MVVYVFTDLDDTLFQTRRKCRPTCSAGTGEAVTASTSSSPLNGAVLPDLRIGAVSRTLEPLSYLLPHQQALFGLLDAHTRIIPVTARNRDAFRRVCLPFRHGAVLNYGGTILTPEGEPDPIWEALMRPRLDAIRPLLDDALDCIRSIMTREGLACAARLVRDGDSEPPFYALAKFPQGCLGERPEERLAELRLLRDVMAAEFLPRAEGRLHWNDNNLAFIPHILNKAHAVRHIMETRLQSSGEEYTTLGMGDSLEDLAFMNLCEYSMAPRTSQIAAARLRG